MNFKNRKNGMLSALCVPANDDGPIKAGAGKRRTSQPQILVVNKSDLVAKQTAWYSTQWKSRVRRAHILMERFRTLVNLLRLCIVHTSATLRLMEYIHVKI